MILPDDIPVPNPVDDHNAEAVHILECVGNPDVAADTKVDNPDVAANSDVAANLDGDGNPEVDANPEGDDNNEDDTNADDDWGESDEIEYVGVDDEKEKYKDVLNDDVIMTVITILTLTQKMMAH